ncbi:hypothetical protein J3Q00_00630 [Pseudomonas sp. D2-3]
MDTKPGHGGTSLAGLPEHYREGGSVGAAFNEAGGLPNGYRRVLNTKTGNTEVVSSDGVFYFETASGLRPKAGGNLAGQVEAERSGKGDRFIYSAIATAENKSVPFFCCPLFCGSPGGICIQSQSGLERN